MDSMFSIYKRSILFCLGIIIIGMILSIFNLISIYANYGFTALGLFYFFYIMHRYYKLQPLDKGVGQ